MAIYMCASVFLFNEHYQVGDGNGILISVYRAFNEPH